MCNISIMTSLNINFECCQLSKLYLLQSVNYKFQVYACTYYDFLFTLEILKGNFRRTWNRCYFLPEFDRFQRKTIKLNPHFIGFDLDYCPWYRLYCWIKRNKTPLEWCHSLISNYNFPFLKIHKSFKIWQ